jgi:hypothetical protein
MRSAVTACIAVMATLVPALPALARTRLDATFASDRVIVATPGTDGGSLRFYTDTGGGITLIYDQAAKRLNLTATPTAGAEAADFPPSFRRLESPLPVAANPEPPLPAFVGPNLIETMGGPAESDGFLGNQWFAGHIWTWDYAAKTLTLEDDDWHPSAGSKVLPIGFRKPTPGKPTPAFPRIIVSLAGEPTSMLLDTGTETLLTPKAIEAIGGGPALRATSMIVSSRFEAWHAAHPDWPVIEAAQVRTGARMIRVPDVVLAGFQVGPVWFTERPDANFHGMMSASMDAQVEGAIGGNAFRTLHITVDYRASRAAFARP